MIPSARFGTQEDPILAIRQNMKKKNILPIEIHILGEENGYKVFGHDPNLGKDHLFRSKVFSESIDAEMYADTLAKEFKTDVVINEAKAKNPSGHYPSYSAAVQAGEKYANELGFEIEEDEWFQKVGQTKKPSKGKTVRITVGLIDSKTKKESKKGLSMQVFYDDAKAEPNVYELNCYVS